MKCEIRWWMMSGGHVGPVISRGIYPKHHKKYTAFKSMSEALKEFSKTDPYWLDTVKRIEIKCRR